VFFFIASDYKPKPGGVAAYIDSMARGLIDLGNPVRVLAVVPADERERLTFLERYEKWVTPFPIVHDARPRNWLGNKLVSTLEIVRCVRWRGARRLLDSTGLFEASADSVARLRKILLREKPDVVIFGHLDFKLYPFALLLAEERIPYGIIAHDFEIYRWSHRINDIVRRGMMLKRATWLAANSRHTKSLLERWGLSPDKIMIVHPPVAEEALREAEPHLIDTGGRYTLVTICRLVPSKGIDIVLRALKILDAERIPYRYVIAGDGSERQSLEHLVDELGVRGRVQFEGYITEAAKWSLLRNADVFVMPSRVDPRTSHEGFGLAFIEAAAFGVPGVGSTGGGIPDAVIHGTTGLLVPEESSEKLAEALIFLYRNPTQRQEMGRAGLDRARSEFSPRTIAAHFQKEISKRM
jgi:glycosyltransferase involved in cell wall biosynthesis